MKSFVKQFIIILFTFLIILWVQNEDDIKNNIQRKTIFEKYKIRVSETKYTYKSQIENVTSSNDMKLEYKVNYFIDFNGRIIGEEVPYRIDIFKKFKEKVPFKLN